MSAATDTLTVFRRQFRLARRNPAWVIIGLVQPVMYLAFFGPLLKPLAGTLGTTNAYTLFVPGLLVQLGLFGSLFAGFGLVGEWRDGVVEAERVTPASRTALLLGRVLREVLVITVQGALLVSLSLLFGLDGSLPGMLLGLVLTIGVAATCASLSYALALRTHSEDALAPILNAVSMPVLLLSGILLPMTLGPVWLQRVSAVLPTTHIVTGIRALFRGDLASAATLWAVVWTVVLVVVGLAVGTRTFQKASA